MTMQTLVDKTKWVALFEAMGLDEAAMMRWHTLFESRLREGHQAFLEWLNIPPEEIAAIRAHSRS
jgi:hypothetical protein